MFVNSFHIHLLQFPINFSWWWMFAILHWSVRPNVLVQLRQRGGPDVVQHGLHHVRQDGEELLWYPVHCLSWHRQYSTSCFLHHWRISSTWECCWYRGMSFMNNRDIFCSTLYSVFYWLDNHPLCHQHQWPHHSVRHPSCLCGQNMWSSLQFCNNSKYFSQCSSF